MGRNQLKLSNTNSGILYWLYLILIGMILDLIHNEIFYRKQCAVLCMLCKANIFLYTNKYLLQE